MLDINQLIDFCPPDQAGKDEAARIVYYFRPPLYRDRLKLRKMTRRAGGRPVSPEQLIISLQQGIRDIFQGDDCQKNLDLLEEWVTLTAPFDPATVTAARGEDFEVAIEREITARGERIAEMMGAVQAIEAEVERNCPAHRDNLIDQADWREVMNMEAVRLFLVKADNLDLGALKNGCLTDEQISVIPYDHVILLGYEALAHMYPTEDEEKN